MIQLDFLSGNYHVCAANTTSFWAEEEKIRPLVSILVRSGPKVAKQDGGFSSLEESWTFQVCENFESGEKSSFFLHLNVARWRKKTTDRHFRAVESRDADK